MNNPDFALDIQPKLFWSDVFSMAELEVNLSRSYELRLLRCTLPSPTPDSAQSKPSNPPSHLLHVLISEVVSSIESGNYIRALSSDALRFIFKHDGESFKYDDSVQCADRVYSELMNSLDSFLINDSEDSKDGSFRAILVISIAIAAFFAFTQCNVTGPYEELPSCPLPFKVSSKCVEWDNWARNQLTSSGCHLIGKFSNLQYIVFANMLLTRTKDLLSGGSVSSMDELRSISWWLARLIQIQQRILDERSSSLFDLVHVFMGETLNHFGSLEKITSYWGDKLHKEEALIIVSMLHLEAGLMEHAYGRDDSFKHHLESAEVLSGIQLSLTGVLGFRTVHQVEPKAQQVLVSDICMSNVDHTRPSISLDLEGNVSSSCEDNSNLHRHEICEASDVLMIPRLLKNDDDTELSGQGIQNCSAAASPLKAIQQAVILAQCLLIEKSSRHDELQRWDMAPYIEAIDSQQSSYFIIRCFCDIIRIRWEFSRSRTKERALLMMDEVVKGIYESSHGVAQRIQICYAVSIPTIPILRKEYCNMLVGCGLVGEALKIFEDLELWDNLIYCYCLLEKKAAGVELIKKRLAENPNDPRLWCSLGDITNNDSCYEKALSVSNNKSTRAMRSLARSAYNMQNYKASKILWESAMALNSLYPDGWFALGAAALKDRDVEKAMEGFTRAVELDPDNGEAWNNIACLHVIKKKSKEAFIAFKEALKFKRNSWKLWENYSQVAVDVGNFNQALEAMEKVVLMTSYKRVDTELLEKILLEIEERVSASQFASRVATSGYNCTSQTHMAASVNESTPPVFGAVSSSETEHLVELLGKILRKIVGNAGDAEIYGLYARWHNIKGHPGMCSEFLLKQIRDYQRSDSYKDKDRFKKLARASLKLFKIYMEISSCTTYTESECFEFWETYKKKFSSSLTDMEWRRKLLKEAEMHIKSVIKQAGSFSDTDEFRDLESFLDQVILQINSLSSC